MTRRAQKRPQIELRGIGYSRFRILCSLVKGKSPAHVTAGSAVGFDKRIPYTRSDGVLGALLNADVFVNFVCLVGHPEDQPKIRFSLFPPVNPKADGPRAGGLTCSANLRVISAPPR